MSVPDRPDALPSNCAAAASGVLRATGAALARLATSLDLAAVESWTRHVMASEGRVVLSGIGKSGIVAQKIAATFASTGCPSFFLHPGEALHGDLGMVTPRDTMLLLSNSGESEEMLRLLPNLLRIGVPLGCITGRPDSSLASASKWLFAYELPEGEGCPLNFAPMASTSLQMAWGDLLAAYHMTWSGFTLEHFAANHPAGNLGSKLLKVSDLHHKDFPTVAPEDGLLGVLQAMTTGRLGMAVVQEDGCMVGVISDGDIRRGLEGVQRRGQSPLALTAGDLMTPRPITVAPDLFAIEAARILETRKITFLVVAEGNQAEGVLHIHDLLGAKVL